MYLFLTPPHYVATIVGIRRLISLCVLLPLTCPQGLSARGFSENLVAPTAQARSPLPGGARRATRARGEASEDDTLLAPGRAASVCRQWRM